MSQENNFLAHKSSESLVLHISMYKDSPAKYKREMRDGWYTPREE